MVSRANFVLRQAFLLAVVALLFATTLVSAHGSGTLVHQDIVEPYQLSVWVDPDPMVIGEAHITVGVGRAEDGAAITNAIVEVAITDPDGAVTGSLATTEKSVNKFLYEADSVITQTGLHKISVTVNSPAGIAQTAFEIQAEQPRNPWIMRIGIGAVLIAIIVAWRVRSQKINS